MIIMCWGFILISKLVSRDKSKYSHYHKPLRLCASLWIQVLLYLLMLTFRSACASQESVRKDVETLGENLPGCYSQVHQQHKHDQRGLLTHKRHFLTRSEIYKISSPMFNDSLTFYFQDFTKYKAMPIRAGLYSFSVDNDMGVVRMKTFNLEHAIFIVDALKTSENFTLSNDVVNGQGWIINSLRTFSECDMFWKRLEDSTFVGITGPLCLGSLGGNQFRIVVSMALTRDKLFLTEGWYKISGGLRLTEAKISYILQKLQTADTIKHGYTKSRNSALGVQSNEIQTADDQSGLAESRLPSWNNNVQKYPNRFTNTKSGWRKLMKIHRRKSERIGRQTLIKHFRQLITALTSGHDVHFRIELSNCSTSNQVKVDRSSFGGKIQNFVYVRQDGSKQKGKHYIYFVSQTNVMGKQGREVINRHVTIQNNGRIKVKILKIASKSSWIKHGPNFECRLDTGPNDYGGVRFNLNPSEVQTINNFKTLTKSIDQGRNLRLVADLARCQGSRTKTELVIGSQVTNYDFVNGGKTAEVFIPIAQAISSEQVDHLTFKQGFVGHVHKSGDVILTLMNSEQVQANQGLMFHLSPAYHCKLANSKQMSTNEDKENGVLLYYAK